MEYTTAKFIHLIGIFLWAGSSSSLGLFMMYSTWKDTGCNQHALRNFYRWMTNLEIFGFVLALVMGFYMLHLLKYRGDIPWLNHKLPLVLGIILPLEVINFWFINLYIPRSKDKEKAYKRYDLFIYTIAIPLVVVSLLVVYFAVAKV
ncbi:MAG: hypothetical protein ACK4LT_04315 [Aquificaceae bacterium]